MAYVPPKYPAAIPTIGDLPNRADDVDWMYAARYNELKKELRAALIELGTLPKGGYADVKARLDAGISAHNPVFTGIVTAPVIDLTGGQIAFPAGQSASGNANTLDDYEEGTWTPDLLFGGAKVGITYNRRGGYYVKIGSMVWVTAELVLTSKGTSVGDATIAGLPFASKNDPPARSPMAFGPGSTSFADFPMAIVAQNSAHYTIQEYTNVGVESALINTNFANTSHIRIAGSYTI